MRFEFYPVNFSHVSVHITQFENANNKAIKIIIAYFN